MWPDDVTVERETPEQWIVRDVDDPGLLATLTAQWAARGIMPRQFALRRRTLEEVFLQLAQDGGSTSDEDERESA
jgi:hypothetical protein